MTTQLRTDPKTELFLRIAMVWRGLFAILSTGCTIALWTNALRPDSPQGEIAALGANIPSRVSQDALDAFLTFTPPANNQAFLNGIAPAAKPTAEGPLWAGSWPEFSKVMDPAVQGVLTGATTVESFGTTICDEANKVFTK